jgi:hypothetical protein
MFEHYDIVEDFSSLINNYVWRWMQICWSTQKHYHEVKIFNACLNLMHHYDYLKNKLWLKVAIDGGLYLNIIILWNLGTYE